MTPEYISTRKDYHDFFEEKFNGLPDSVRSRLLNDETLKHMLRQMLVFRPEFSREILASYPPNFKSLTFC